MARSMARTVRAAGLLAIALVLAACASEEEPAAVQRSGAVASQLLRLEKVGKLVRGPVLLKSVDEAGIAQPAGVASRELNALVAALQAVLGTRPGTFALVTAAVMDNATLAAQNDNPNYGQLLEQWGRQTGVMVAFEQRGDGTPGLVRASVILSRYGTPEGAHAAYQYVVGQESRVSRRFELQAPAGSRPPWDEAVVFYREATASARTIGFYTLIFRAGNLICFVSNWGLAGAVTPRDTADLTQAVVERLSNLATAR
jgi:hypothetical protein